MTLGLPRMHKEAGERRDFLPGFVERLAGLGLTLFVEEGYGSGMSIAAERYLRNDAIRFADRRECYRQDLVLVLRYPDETDLSEMSPGGCLISMAHLPTRPGRVERLRAAGIEAVSLDGVVDDTGRRLVENLRAVGWGGLEVAFDTLQTQWGRFADASRRPIAVTVLGAGAVGSHAVHAAINYGNTERRRRLAAAGVPGVVVRVVDYDVSGIAHMLEQLLEGCDVLVDATRRRDQSHIVVPNWMLDLLPGHSVVVDLSVDPYDCAASPPAVKAIEGVPQGDLDCYVMPPDHHAWSAVPGCVNTTERRTAVSCYSWPGIHPRQCMEIYGKQIFPFVRALVEAGGPTGIRPDSGFFHRAISRAMLSRFVDVGAP
jgi:alanine dehydrogenase